MVVSYGGIGDTKTKGFYSKIFSLYYSFQLSLSYKVHTPSRSRASLFIAISTDPLHQTILFISVIQSLRTLDRVVRGVILDLVICTRLPHECVINPRTLSPSLDLSPSTLSLSHSLSLSFLRIEIYLHWFTLFSDFCLDTSFTFVILKRVLQIVDSSH